MGCGGQEALALTLLGDENRFGRLPITMYDKAYTGAVGSGGVVDFHNFDMAKPPGRTYKYYTGKPLFSFGSGQSYSQFKSTCTMAQAGAGSHTISCSVVIAGGATSGDEVLMAFHSVGSPIRAAAKHPVPIKELVAFERLSLSGSTPATVQLHIGPQQLGLVDETGTKQLVAGAHTITVTNGNSFSQAFVVQVAASEVLIRVPAMPARLS